jgi:hypothetical protein
MALETKLNSSKTFEVQKEKEKSDWVNTMSLAMKKEKVFLWKRSSPTVYLHWT